MVQANMIESAIFQELSRVRTCTLEELNERLPYYSWIQVFSAVDRLNRGGSVILERTDPFGYSLSLTPLHITEADRVTAA